MTTLRPPPLTLLDKHSGQGAQTLYSTTVTVTGGKAAHGRASGIARSDDGQFAVDLRMPKALGGPGGGTNPEQLFAAGYAACFHGALSLLAARAGIPIPGASVEVKVDFGRDPVDGLFMLTAHTRVRLPGVERAVAGELVRNTERYCPYTKMARHGIENVVALVPADDESNP
ncbi:Ohr family peroxiredoxin [Paraburkholderia guartelaensis]|uniref:Ohr family peroxiredoxin n=1 Tax=Paraburkholderia guartelaensis TaxID=2546446 RepID=UPI002AB7518C|nr:Ohr family peroxiredoxin [Paraburkholderia guartelaensis]